MTELEVILNSKSLLIMLLVPSMAVGLLLISLSYKLTMKLLDDFGKPFIAAQQKQAEAFEQIALGVKLIQSTNDSRRASDEDVRVTLRILNEKCNRLLKEQEGTNGPQ